MEPRPKVKLEPDLLDQFVDGLALFGLLMLLLLPILYYAELPDTIPMHFNAGGEADGFGQKAVLWVLPALGLGLFLGMHWLQSKPHLYNYPVKISAENAERQYRTATRLIRALKLAVMFIFAYLSWGTIQVALQQQTALSPAFVWGFMGLIFSSLGWYVWKAHQLK